MSLKDAIREAVDERHKQESSLINPVEAPQDGEASNNEPLSNGLPETQPPKTEELKTRQRQDAANKAANTASNKAAFTASSNAVTPETQNSAGLNQESGDTAALTIRVPRQHRIHWLISAKKEGTSLTAAITEALNARFGEPSKQ